MRSSLFSGGEVPQLEVPLLDGRLEVPGPPLLPVAPHAGCKPSRTQPAMRVAAAGLSNGVP